MPGATPAQTVGPFFSLALLWPGPELVPADHPGPRLRLVGQVLDGAGAPVDDALVEIWQADPDGRYPDADAEDFAGVGRCATAADGSFAFDTLRPGPVPGPDGSLQAPHVSVVVHARGLLNPLFTRAYLADDPRNADDPVLAGVPAQLRPRLLAEREPDRTPPTYRFSVHLKGPDETPFFDV